MSANLSVLTDAVRNSARVLTGHKGDYDRLLQLIGDARIVLLGEATHGTHEFYRERARITKRLIRERGFHAVAVEADWADAWRVNCYVQGQSDDGDAAEALSGFRRFPAWMWRNAEVLDFLGWLRAHNDARPESAELTGFYGLDLYSLHSSLAAALRSLNRADPEAAARARERFSCFETYGAAPETARLGLDPAFESAIAAQLVEMQRGRSRDPQREGRLAEDDFFHTQQNARLLHTAEQYYRSIFHSCCSAWNLREHHMVATLDALVEHLTLRNPNTKIVVWAHNAHVGDARATSVSRCRKCSMGQLMRERHGGDCRLVGFTTFSGTVTAAPEWGGHAERMRLAPSASGSCESLFHETGLGRFFLPLGADRIALPDGMAQKAIGLVYESERADARDVIQASVSKQFDALIHVDTTRAVEPLEAAPMPEGEFTGPALVGA